MQITEESSDGLIVRGYDSKVPSTDAGTYAVGAMIINTSNGQTYQNVGTTASPSWIDTTTSVQETNTYSGAQIGSVRALTSTSGSIAFNLALSNNYSHVLTENTTIANPTNATAGTGGNIKITQHASAAKTLAYGNIWKTLDGTAQTVSTTVGAINVLTFYYDGTYVWYSMATNGVA